MNSSSNNRQATQQHIQLLERRYLAVKGSLEMLTVFEQPNLKSARAMVEDAQALLDAAKHLHAVIAAMEDDSLNQDALTPDLSHRWAPLLGGINLWCVTETIDYTALKVCSLLSLLRCQFVDNVSSRLDDESLYYSFATVSMDIKDIAAFIDAFKPMWEIYQHKSAPAGHRAFVNIEQSLTKALSVIYLLCNQFADDDSLSDSERICGAIDSIAQDIADIRLSVKNLHKVIRNYQA